MRSQTRSTLINGIVLLLMGLGALLLTFGGHRT